MEFFNKHNFTNQPKLKENLEVKRTKEEAQAELIERFNMRKTSDFQTALQKGEIDLAKEWLNYIIENKENFPQYEATWNNWLTDRQNEIILYENLKNNGSLEKMTHRSKEEAQAELIEKFNLRKTSDFQAAIKEGKIELAENWLNYIVKNKLSFPQYLSTWDNWLADRQREIDEAKI